MLWLWAAEARAEAWTLHDALEHALAHNLDLRAAHLAADAADAALAEARARFGPTFSAEVGASGFRGGSGASADGDSRGVGVALSQPLPTGGTVGLTWESERDYLGAPADWSAMGSARGVTVTQPLLDGAWGDAWYDVTAARLAARDEALRERASVEAAVMGVADAYWGLVGARENTRLARRSAEIARQQLADTRERHEEGFAGSGDVLQVERALGVAEQARVVAEAAEFAAQRGLARRLGLSQVELAPLELADLPAAPAALPELAAALATAETGNVDLLRAGVAVQAAKLALRHARSDALPDLDVAGSVGWSASVAPGEDLGEAMAGRPDRAWAVTSSLTVPLVPPIAELRGARLALEVAEVAALAAREDLVADLDAALRAVERDRARVDLATATLVAAQKGLDADQELYREGRGSTRDVVRSLEALEEAQAARLRAEIDLQASFLEVHRLQGTLFQALALMEP